MKLDLQCDIFAHHSKLSKRWVRMLFVDAEKVLRRASSGEMTLKRLPMKARRLLRTRKTVTLGVALVGRAAMARLNKNFRGEHYATDVLSFEGDCLEGGSHLGDLAICVPVVARQAKQYSESVEVECARLVLHGLLHLFGMDHSRRKDEEAMFLLQETLLRQLPLLCRSKSIKTKVDLSQFIRERRHG